MPFLSTVISGVNAAALVTNLNAFFAANLTARVHQMGYVGRDHIALQGLELTVSILYDTDGVSLGATPFVAQTVVAPSAAGLATDAAALIAAAPNNFWAGPFIDFLNQSRRLEKYTGLLISSANANAAGNWQAGGQSIAPRSSIVAADSPHTATAAVILADATAGAITVNLPPAAEVINQFRWIKKSDAGVNAVTVDGNGAETIDGAATVVLAASYEAVTIFSDGTAWHIL